MTLHLHANLVYAFWETNNGPAAREYLDRLPRTLAYAIVVELVAREFVECKTGFADWIRRRAE